MRKSDLVDVLVKNHGMSKSAAARVIDDIFGSISDALAKGKRVDVYGFGAFVISKRSARKGRNPRTGEEIKIPASKVVRFKSSSALKEAVN